MFPFLWRTALDSKAGCALFVFFVIQYIFPFKWDELRVTRVVQLCLHLRLNYYEAKIQMLSAFQGNQLSRGSSKQKLKFVLSESL